MPAPSMEAPSQSHSGGGTIRVNVLGAASSGP